MMGVVYRAVDPALGRTVALKTVSLSWAVPEEEREGFERRFLTEAQVAAALNHPGIVVVHDVGRDPATDTLYIALEYLRGGDPGRADAAAASRTGGRPCAWPPGWRTLSTTPTPGGSSTGTSSRRT